MYKILLNKIKSSFWQLYAASNFDNSDLSALVPSSLSNSSSLISVSFLPPSSTQDSPCALACYDAASELLTLRLVVLLDWLPTPCVRIVLRKCAVMSFLRLALRCDNVSFKFFTSSNNPVTFWPNSLSFCATWLYLA